MLTKVGKRINVLLNSWLPHSMLPNARGLGGRFHILMKTLSVPLDVTKTGHTHLSGRVSIHIYILNNSAQGRLVYI